MNGPVSSTDQIKHQALAKLHEGRAQEARALLTQICFPEQTDPDAWHILATINGQLGLFTECEACARQVLLLQPEAAAAHNVLGAALMAQNRDHEARQCFELALQRSHDNVETLSNLGKLFLKQNDDQAAITYLGKAVALEPNRTEALYQLGVAQHRAGKLTDAESSFSKACATQPNSSQLLQCMAAVQRAAGRDDAAVDSLRRALAVDPGNAHIYTELGNTLNELGQYQDAVVAFRDAVRCMPQSPQAHYNLAHAFHAADDFDNADRSYRHAIKLKPDLIVAYNNLGQVCEDKGLLSQALTFYREGLKKAREPTHARCPPPGAESSPVAEIHWHRSLTWLLTGNFEDGWREYEWRWAGNHMQARQFPQPRWNGESLQDRTILVYAEQGVGDELMFASCLNDLIGKAKHVVIDCDTRLAPLFQRSFCSTTVCGGAQTRDPAWLRNCAPIDLQVAAGSLPALLRPTLESFPAHHGYLVADHTKIESWRARYAALGDGLKIGLSWRGGNALKSRKRSTHLEQWDNILTLPGAHFINLQYGECSAELANSMQGTGVPIHDWEDADPLADLDNFAAQVAALDLVISVDNATVHMAGALGVPVWTMLPFAPEWRWLLGCEHSYWYPNMRHYRQPSFNDWQTVFRRVGADLAALLKDRANTTQDAEL